MKILIAVIPLLAGFLLDCLLGDPYSLPHPIRLIGRLISSLEKWVRCRFSSRLVLGGVVMSIIILLTSTLIPLEFLVLCYKLNVWLGVVLESVLCYYMLAARCLRNESMKVYKAIVENDTEKARKAVSMIVGRDTKPLDRNGIIRAAPTPTFRSSAVRYSPMSISRADATPSRWRGLLLKSRSC